MIFGAQMLCAEMAVAEDTLAIRPYARLIAVIEITTPHCR